MERKKQSTDVQEGAGNVEESTQRTAKRVIVYTPWNINNWMIFLTERAPPLFFLLMAAGPCLSVLYNINTGLPIEKFVWAILAEQILLLVIRVMDDVKDFEKDKIVHPERPLPRGLIQYDEVTKFINIALLSTVAYGGLLSLRFGFDVGATYELQVAYAYLMYVEFGMGEWLEERPFLYSLTHEVSCFTGTMFLAALAGEGWLSWNGFLYGCLGFSGFFIFDICRKLDPYLPKLKGTYLVVYGKWPVFAATSLLTIVGMSTSYAIDIHGLLWPLQLALIGSLLFLFLMPPQSRASKRHKPVEVLSAIYMILHLWMPFIAKLLSAQR